MGGYERLSRSEVDEHLVRGSIVDVRYDAYTRPCVTLRPTGSDESHDVILESLRPTVTGFCVSCFESHLHDACGARKARSCPPMVAYLSHLNRDRSMRRGLEHELDRIRELDRLLIS